MKKIKVSPGIFWVEIPEADLYILCGCPGDTVKHLIKKGLVKSVKNSKGILIETGPNAILLSDVTMQKELFSNQAEFPVLQMLYRQGMIIPNHPQNTGIKPLIMGIKAEIEAQSEYIYRGNYGLSTFEEIMDAGLDLQEAEAQMDIKLKFAFGHLRETNALLDTLEIAKNKVEIRNGAFIERKGLNQFVITYKTEAVEVDLNLMPFEDYECPYNLVNHKFKRDYFSIVHTGEGNGWDVERPCMASILNYQGKIYLIDAGPNLMFTLLALGIGINEIEGIFHTHAHDDHFSGLALLMRSDHRIKYYSSKLVRTSAIKKLSALTLISEAEFDHYFDFVDLDVDVWNDIDGLEVKPVYSPHPLETNIFFFRVKWDGKYRTYAHLADIAAFDVLENMVTDSSNGGIFDRKALEKIKWDYLETVDLKKVDIGGGLIHGKAEDFRKDKSERILLSHVSKPLSQNEKEVGQGTFFGDVDELISGSSDYYREFISSYIRMYFPNAPSMEIKDLLNNDMVTFEPNCLILDRGKINNEIFIVVSGIVEYDNPKANIRNKLTVGSMIGEVTGVVGKVLEGDYRAISHVRALVVKRENYVAFLKRNDLLDTFIKTFEQRLFLQKTWLFGERISCGLKCDIANSMARTFLNEGLFEQKDSQMGVYLIIKGSVVIKVNGIEIEELNHKDFFGAEKSILKNNCLFEYHINEGTEVYFVPIEQVERIPNVKWKMFETYNRRQKTGQFMERD